MTFFENLSVKTQQELTTPDISPLNNKFKLFRRRTSETLECPLTEFQKRIQFMFPQNQIKQRIVDRQRKEFEQNCQKTNSFVKRLVKCNKKSTRKNSFKLNLPEVTRKQRRVSTNLFSKDVVQTPTSKNQNNKANLDSLTPLVNIIYNHIENSDLSRDIPKLNICQVNNAYPIKISQFKANTERHSDNSYQLQLTPRSFQDMSECESSVSGMRRRSSRGLDVLVENPQGYTARSMDQMSDNNTRIISFRNLDKIVKSENFDDEKSTIQNEYGINQLKQPKVMVNQRQRSLKMNSDKVLIKNYNFRRFADMAFQNNYNVFLKPTKQTENNAKKVQGKPVLKQNRLEEQKMTLQQPRVSSSRKTATRSPSNQSTRSANQTYFRINPYAKWFSGKKI